MKKWVNIFAIFVFILIGTSVFADEAEGSQLHALLVNGAHSIHAANDGIDRIQNVLETNKAFEGLPTEIVYTFDAANADQADFQGFLQAISKAYALATETDIGFFYYIGHGKENGLVLWTDGEETEVIGYSELAYQLARSKCQTIIVILDACHSEAFYTNGVCRLPDVDQQRFIVLSACCSDQTALFVEDRYSRFTRLIGEGLGNSGELYADFDHDGLVSVKELSDYVNIKIREDLLLLKTDLSADFGYSSFWNDQTPVIHFGNEDFVIYSSSGASAAPEPTVPTEWADCYATFELIADEQSEKGIVRGYNASNELTWIYETSEFPRTQLQQVIDLGRNGELYYVNVSGTVTAINMSTGEVVWESETWVGSNAEGAYQFDEDGYLYISGYYGPDLAVLSPTGDTVACINLLDYGYYWPYSLIIDEENMAVISFGESPEGVQEWSITVDVKSLIETGHFLSDPITLGNVSGICSAVSCYCIDQDLDFYSLTVENPGIFWKIMTLYANETLFQPEYTPRTGDYGAYMLIDKEILIDVAYTLFPDFQGILPSTSSEYVWFDEEADMYALSIADFYGIFSGIRRISVNEDASVNAEIVIDAAYENSQLGTYKVHFIPDKSYAGESENDDFPCSYRAEAVELVSRGLSEDDKNRQVLDEYKSAIDFLNTMSHSMDLSATVDLTNGDQSFREVVSYTGNIAFDHEHTVLASGSCEVTVDGTTATYLEYYSDGTTVYCDYRIPHQQKIRTEQIPLQSLLDIPSELDDWSIYNAYFEKDYISFNFDSRLLNLDALIRDMLNISIDYTCTDASISLQNDSEGRPLEMSMGWDMTFVEGTESATAYFSVKIMFNNYGTVTVYPPDDLISYN